MFFIINLMLLKLNTLLLQFSKNFDKLYKFWESKKSLRFTGTIIVFVYIFTLILIQFKHWNLLPQFISKSVTSNYFFAIEIAFNFLLIVEILGMIFVLSYSISESVAKQFEIFSLILLRHAFQDFSEFSETLIWFDDLDVVIQMLANTFGALIIFIIVLYFKKAQKHIKICKKDSQERFVIIKKMLSILMIIIFTFAGSYSLYAIIFLGQDIHFFKSFYTVLIFTDILIVLISIRYSHLYIIVFRNSGYALATVIIRLALTAPIFYSITLGILASIFIFILSFIYNKFRKII